MMGLLALACVCCNVLLRTDAADVAVAARRRRLSAPGLVHDPKTVVAKASATAPANATSTASRPPGREGDAGLLCDPESVDAKAPATAPANVTSEEFREHLLVEQHLMVDWTRHYSEEHVRSAIRRWPNLSILDVVQHPAYSDDEERVRVFSSFYNTRVDDFRGRSAFNMYFINDINPVYDLRPSSKGERLVNVAVFDFKKVLREGMGGGFKIHATDNIQELKDNLKSLGMQCKYRFRRFDTLSQVFETLNSSGTKYVVLRNFERMPGKDALDPHHPDVDLLVDDYYAAKRVLDGDSLASFWDTSFENGHYRIVNAVSIGGADVHFDLRRVGDDYLDKRWQEDILQRRTAFQDGMRLSLLAKEQVDKLLYVPSAEDHLYSLIYDATVQKKSISDTYVKAMMVLGNYTTSQARDKAFLRGKLDLFMSNHTYNMVKPHDKSVLFVL